MVMGKSGKAVMQLHFIKLCAYIYLTLISSFYTYQSNNKKLQYNQNCL